ncbi:tetratricopeptide repeat protein [Synechococcus sp. MW101C3]|uniref:tetratricopeptide repeat-containing glycosyltransferase family protein n=1 Tax=Synechococcus sp. MW101C3 TaxID=210768 RepID=UPI000B9900D6|nr:tetratricopeptide repeat protein [Synechococcus sp. MW101C3]
MSSPQYQVDPSIEYTHKIDVDLTDPEQIDATLVALDAQLAASGATPDLLVAMSHLLEAKGQLDRAIESMQFAVLLDGTNISMLIRLGDLLIKAGEPDSAEAAYSQVITLAPELSNGLVGLAQALSDQGRMNEALLHAERAVQQDPQQPRTHEIHGLVLAQLGRMGDAITAFTDGLRLDPSNANQLAYRGMAKLACMYYQEAWQDFAWRFASDTGDVERHQDLPLWTGEPISTPVLIWREQGLGDEILYFGWLRCLMATGQPFVAEVEPRLLALCRRSLPGAIIIPLGESPNDFGVTHALPMGSLGEFVGAYRSTPAFPPRYLQSEPATTARFAHQLTSSSAGLSPLRIGLAWKSIRPRVGAFKSIELSLFLPMARDSRLQLINLQYDTTAEEIEGFNKQAVLPMIDPAINKRQDINSLASVIDCCDLVITISNVTAHLACALGKECWVLLPAGRGLIWYWHCNISYSPFYPTARLFRQQTINSWDGVVCEVHAALAERLQRKTPPKAG